MLKVISQIASAMENGEYDFDGTQEQKPTHPVNTRAGSVKAQISDIENVKYKLENKDEEIKELRKLLRMKVSMKNIYCKFGKDCVSLIFAFFLRLASDAKLKLAMISAATLSL